MNREIKFRVWYKNKMYYPYFYAFEDKNIVFDWKLGDFTKSSYDFQQFTGLKDKNGKEIYEGDIVNFVVPGHNHGPESENIKNAEIWWSQEDLQFLFGRYKTYNTDWGYTLFSEVKKDSIEVIGNIFENPELLNNNK